MNITIRDGEEFIRLGQALKKAGAVGSGSDRSEERRVGKECRL